MGHMRGKRKRFDMILKGKEDKIRVLMAPMAIHEQDPPRLIRSSTDVLNKVT